MGVPLSRLTSALGLSSVVDSSAVAFPPAKSQHFARRFVVAFLAATTLFVVAAPEGSAATPAPALSITSTANPTHFVPGASSTGAKASYAITVTNVSSVDTDGSQITIADQLPPGVTVDPTGGGLVSGGTEITNETGGEIDFDACAAGPPLTCPVPTDNFGGTLVIHPGQSQILFIILDVDAGAPPVLTNHASVSGGGAPAVSTTEQTPVSSTPAPFGFQNLRTSIYDDAGAPETQAGSHPYLLQTGFQLNTVFDPAHANPPAGAPKDVAVRLPRGMILDPNATPARCTEVQLETGGQGGRPTACPDASEVGFARPTIGVFGYASPAVATPIYNMVPPPGAPAELAFNAASLDIFVHLRGGVDAAGDYQLTADASDIPQYGTIEGTYVDLWGDPSDPSHDAQRTFSVPATHAPLLTMPSACSDSLATDFSVDSWQDPGNFVSAQAPTLDSQGNPLGATGCSQLAFDPTLAARPDTTAADSPTGLDVSLHVPQTTGQDTLATANLKQTVVDLPAGMAVNPSAADGLGSCTPAQVGLTTPIGQAAAHFTAAPDTCPDSAKIGTVQITTPLLPDPLQGDVYLAQQDHNPFPNPSLLALYITIKDPTSGIVLKLPGQVSPDPQTGQLRASFDDTPELPFSDFDLHFKGGNRATLVTPPSCGTYETSSTMSPWSAADPNNPTLAETRTSTDSFQLTTGPNGGPCPDYTDPARFTPGFSAGTVSPQAGGSSPFVLKITRPDGQQNLKQIHIDMPPGLVAHLAGVPRCSQAQITPGVGGSTNCPADSQIGTVNIGAGAGSTPFFLQDQPVYLTDGYNGAPYGIAIDTHALAGPFDLGHVVIRSTLNVDPDDAQVHIDSEQIPNIIQGVPLHIRSVAVNVDRLGFILNPTNCNPMQVTGTVTGGGADFANPADDTVKPVSTPFQVSGCGALGFSPHLSGTILNGAQGIHRSDHPNLQFNLGYTIGDANIASVGVLLPSSFQIDQANLGNICSETQLATNECAGRNPVGTASATTPILGSTLSGPVYAVSGSGGLPKLAVILHGPPADPVKLLVRGITSTVGARILNTFPLVPDAPVSNFQLTLNGGPTGYLVNNTDVCAGAKGKSKKARRKASRLRRTNLTADANFTAQDGDTLSQSVPITAQCPKAKKSNKSSRSARHRKH